MSSETVDPDDVEWDVLAYVTTSEYRKASLKALHGTVDNPTGIAERLNESKIKIARALADLRDRGLVDTVDVGDDDREVHYELSEDGRDIHQALNGNVHGAPAHRDPPVKWDHIGYVDSSKGRRAVIQRLSESPATPKRIADSNDNVVIADVSNALSSLRDKGLVELLVDEDRRKGRYYGLTDLGRSVAAGLQEVIGDE